MLINELKEKKEKVGELFVLHELINNLDQRIKENNLKFEERNYKKLDKETIFESKTKDFGISLDEQIEKLKKMEINLNIICSIFLCIYFYYNIFNLLISYKIIFII